MRFSQAFQIIHNGKLSFFTGLNFLLMPGVKNGFYRDTWLQFIMTSIVIEIRSTNLLIVYPLEKIETYGFSS